MVWKEIAQRFCIQAGVSQVVPKEHGLTVTSWRLGDTDLHESGVLWDGRSPPCLTLVFECSHGIRASQQEWQALAVKQVSGAYVRAPFPCL